MTGRQTEEVSGAAIALALIPSLPSLTRKEKKEKKTKKRKAAGRSNLIRAEGEKEKRREKNEKCCHRCNSFSCLRDPKPTQGTFAYYPTFLLACTYVHTYLPCPREYSNLLLFNLTAGISLPVFIWLAFSDMETLDIERNTFHIFGTTILLINCIKHIILWSASC